MASTLASTIHLHFTPSNSSDRSIRQPHSRVWKCSSSSAPQQPPKQKQRRFPPNKKTKGDNIAPVGFLSKLGISDRAFTLFLRKRYKAFKDRKAQLLSRHLDLLEAASGYEILGMHRHRHHRIDFMEWAPGARYCSLVGDFNGWSATKNSAREGHFGHDDFAYWFIILEDKLRHGEEAREYYFQEYNYVDDHDKGDNGVDVVELLKRVYDEYWEPSEVVTRRSCLEMVAKLYEQMFGPNGPQTEGELGEIPDAETRYKEWNETQNNDSGSILPSYDVMDNGKEYDIYNVINDPISREKFRAKKPPIPYWIEMRKGRKTWLKKYLPAIPHGSRYRFYFNTPDGALERVSAWSTYVLPGAEGKQYYAVHWEPPLEVAYKWNNKRPKVPKPLRIYECHVGISGSEQRISTFSEFISRVLPHIKNAGYNAIQLIGIVEHRDYSSVGYKIVSVLVCNQQTRDKMLLYAENHNQSISGGSSFAEVLLRKFSDHPSDVSFNVSSTYNEMTKMDENEHVLTRGAPKVYHVNDSNMV